MEFIFAPCLAALAYGVAWIVNELVDATCEQRALDQAERGR